MQDVVHPVLTIVFFNEGKKHSPCMGDAPQAAEFVLVKQANTLINHFASKGRPLLVQ